MLATFLLLFAGGLVTSTDSGLAVPDWPLSYGSFFPPMVGGIRFEHTHRLIASTVGLLTLILTFWIGKTEKRTWIRRLAIASLGAVVLQGIFGGLTVLFLLPVPISVAHACLGPLFFCLVTVLATVTSPSWETKGMPRFCSSAEIKNFHRLSLATTLFFFFQMILGAILRHTAKGVWPHLLTAIPVFILTSRLVTQAVSHFADKKEIVRLALFLGALVVTQFFLGVGAFVFTRVPEIPHGLGQVIFPTFHQTLGAVILTMGVLLCLYSNSKVVAAKP